MIFTDIVGLMTALAVVTQPSIAHAQSIDAYLPNVPGFSQNEKCESIDLRAVLGPVKSQGETSFCFAYTSAELIQQRTGVAVSALEIATGFYFTNPRFVETTTNPAVREFARSRSVFSAWIRDARYADGVDIADGDKTAHPTFALLQGGYEAQAMFLANSQGLCPDSSLPSADGFQSFTDVIAQLTQAALTHSVHAGPEVSDVDPRFRDAEADIFNTGWLRFVKKKCRRVVSPAALLPVEFSIARSLKDYRQRAEAITPGDGKRLISVLNFSLENRRMPAIGFDLDGIISPEVKKAEAAASGKNQLDPYEGDHSVSIVARRKIGGECRYLIRDSSGYDCDSYRADLQPFCKNHEIWLSENALLGSAFYALVYLR